MLVPLGLPRDAVTDADVSKHRAVAVPRGGARSHGANQEHLKVLEKPARAQRKDTGVVGDAGSHVRQTLRGHH